METKKGNTIQNSVGLEVRKLTKRIQKEFEMKLVTEVMSNPKAVWNYMNFKTKNRKSVSDLNTDPKSRLTDSDREKADVFGHFFQVF